MTLATITINDAVRHQTDLIIKKLTYQSLRQYILERKPLDAVNEAIDSMLLEAFKKDKHHFTQQLQNEASEQQQARDLKEAQLDAQEQVNDQLLKTNLSDTFPDLERNKAQVELNYLQQEHKTKQIDNEVNELRARIKTINNSIDQVRLNRQLVITQIPYIYTPLMTHYHYHCHQHPASIYSGYPVYQQASWAYSLNEEANLTSERTRLIDILASKTSEYCKEQITLNSLLNEKKTLEQQVQTHKSQLTRVLPDKEYQRQIRNQERNARAIASTNENNISQQLSYNSSEELNEKTAEKIVELNNLFNQLKHNSRAIGFAIFLNQLNTLLVSPDKDHITFSERNALEKMLVMINRYNEIVANQDKIKADLFNERAQFQDLQLDEKKINVLIKESNKLEGDFVTNLNDINNEKNSLQQQIDLASTIKKSMLFTSLFGLSSGALSIGLIITFTANPLLFIIPAALALITVVALGIALGYDWHKSQKEKLLDKTIELGDQNIANIGKEKKKSTVFNQSILPGVIQKISQSEERIKELDAQSQQQQHEMDILFNKIENISPAKAANSSLFDSNPKPKENINEQHEELNEYQQIQAFE